MRLSNNLSLMEGNLQMSLSICFSSSPIHFPSPSFLVPGLILLNNVVTQKLPVLVSALWENQVEIGILVNIKLGSKAAV